MMTTPEEAGAKAGTEARTLTETLAVTGAGRRDKRGQEQEARHDSTRASLKELYLDFRSLSDAFLIQVLDGNPLLVRQFTMRILQG